MNKFLLTSIAFIALSSSSWATTLLTQFPPIGQATNNANKNFNPSVGSPLTSIKATVPTDAELASDLANTTSYPNARKASNAISAGTATQENTDDPNASAWVYVFGQFVDHDLGLSDITTASTDISVKVAAGDPQLTNGGKITMHRATAKQTSENLMGVAATTYITDVSGMLDLSQVYGNSVAESNTLRNMNPNDGTLKMTAFVSNPNSTEQYLPMDNTGAFLAGDARATENFELTAAQTLWAREHNRLVAKLKAANPTWTGQQLFQMARTINIAEYQRIVYAGWIPVLVGGTTMPAYAGYKASIDPRESMEFAVTAYRLHTLVEDCEAGITNNGTLAFNEKTSNVFHNTATQDLDMGIANMLRGITGGSSTAGDVYVVNSLRNLLFAPLPPPTAGESGEGDTDLVDLIAIDIQRARDAGIPKLNDMRDALTAYFATHAPANSPYKGKTFPRYTSITELTSDTAAQKALTSIYGNIDNVELFEGGMAENHAAGAMVGPTFQAIIIDQFQRLRDGDQFYYLNEKFDAATLAQIRAATLTSLILANTNTTIIKSSDNAFLRVAAQSNFFDAPSLLRKFDRFAPGPWNGN